jgi:hypothetical protein
MIRNLTPKQIYDFIVRDFEGAWDSVAANNEPIGRGNFMFSGQAMILLEFASRLCAGDLSTASLKAFSQQMQSIEPNYFTRLPGPCAHIKDFSLPYIGTSTDDLLLWALFDLIRNGLAHQYQQILVTLHDKKQLYITVTGAQPGLSLASALKSRPKEHLAYSLDSNGDIGFWLCPHILFLDIQNSMIKCKLLDRGLSFQYLSRPRGPRIGTHPRPPKGIRYYDFDSTSLISCFKTQGHIRTA